MEASTNTTTCLSQNTKASLPHHPKGNTYPNTSRDATATPEFSSTPVEPMGSVDPMGSGRNGAKLGRQSKDLAKIDPMGSGRKRLIRAR